MTPIERFWLDILSGRRHIINEVYGNEAMLRYRPHPREKELFINNAGQVPYDEDVAEYTQRFFAFCDERFAQNKAAYRERIAENGRRARSFPEYKKNADVRNQLQQKIAGVILGHAKTQHQDRQQGQQAAEQDAKRQEAIDARTTQKESR